MIKLAVKNFLKLFLSQKQRKTLRNIQHSINESLLNKNDLSEIGLFYGTDKIGSHYYTQHYMTYLQKIRKKHIRLLEIGVGGYDNPNFGGHSLRMWKKYFSHGQIYGLDIYDKSALQEKRITIFKGSQIDNDFLEDVIKRTGELDIIIDDGSHLNEHIIETFKILFPKLKQGGIYVVEDIQTSYWPDMGGDSQNLLNQNTAMNFFKGLTDGLNYEEYLIPGYEPSYYDENISDIHFYHNMVFVSKNKNNEGSNMVRNGKI
ncbi:hypothetical protein FACS1894102_5500 [Spirochaetia bacterium]|nr:hypothetical protein FACS1894102_5500 [Spirochaetia bacterium]